MFECIWHYLTEELNDFEWLNKNSKPIQSALMQMTAHHVLLGLVLTSCSAWSLSFQIEPESWRHFGFCVLTGTTKHGMVLIPSEPIWFGWQLTNTNHPIKQLPDELNLPAMPRPLMPCRCFCLGVLFISQALQFLNVTIARPMTCRHLQVR